MKKSYNPFKMLGSWVGAVICSLPLLSGLIFPKYFLLFLMKINLIYYWESWCHEAGCGFFTLGTLPILGFLIGWGIHSLIRKLRR